MYAVLYLITLTFVITWRS